MTDQASSERFDALYGERAGDGAAFTMRNGHFNESQGVGDTSTRTFPQKLMDVLSDESHSEIISWCDHGNAFMIHKKKVFASEILSKHFNASKSSKFTSFTRKLNRWGFNRVSRGPETGAYHHKWFCRDKPELCIQMMSNSGSKSSSIPLHQQPLPNIINTMGRFGYPGMAMPGPYVPIMTSTESTAPQQTHSMWQQQMQLMQMQNMQMMQQMQVMQQGMLQGIGMMQTVPGAMPENRESVTQGSIDDHDPLLEGTHHAMKGFPSNNDEGDTDLVHPSLSSASV